MQTKKQNQTNTVSFVSTQWNHQKSLQQFNQVIIILGDNKLVITTKLKTFHFDLPKDAGMNLKHKIYSIIKHNELLVEHIIKFEVRKLLPNMSMKTIFTNMKTRLDFRSSNKHVALQNLSVYYTWKNVRQ